VRNEIRVFNNRPAPIQMKTITFTNGKGAVLRMNSSLTISDLKKMGIKKIVLIESGKKLPKNWWRTK
jgi:hypothetical protein